MAVNLQMAPVTKIAERLAIQETISERLVGVVDRLGEVADGLRTNIAVHNERLDNQDRILGELKDSIESHQAEDRRLHGEMTTKLDNIQTSVDQLTGANKSLVKVEQEADTLWDKAKDVFIKFRYAFYGALFAAGVLTHKAHFFEWILKFLVGSD